MPEESICLNMIVKNESGILRDTFDNLLKYFKFSNYVIVDTGSTDNTISVIKDYFKEKNIRGKVYKSIFRDFGYNRTEALEKAFNTSDYILIFDADDRITGNFTLPNKLEVDAYNLILGDEKFNYTRPLLVTNRKKWRFVGVLHEYLEAVNFAPTFNTIKGPYFVISGRFGDRSKQSNKYERDAIVFEKAILTCPAELKPRYAFYCAQSYKDSNNVDKAIEWYLKRLEYKGYAQENFYSCLMLSHLYQLKGDIKNSLYYNMLSFEIDDERIEGLYQVIKYHRENNNFNIALDHYKKIRKPVNYENKLFVFTEVYNHLMDIEMALIHYEINPEDGIPHLSKLLDANYNESIFNDVLLILIKYIDIIPKFTDLKFLANFYKFAKKIPESLAPILSNKLILSLTSKYNL